jgi:hypothetical protein
MKANRINPATEYELARVAQTIRYQNKQMEIKRMEEMVRIEKERIKRIDPKKGQNVDITV